MPEPAAQTPRADASQVGAELDLDAALSNDADRMLKPLKQEAGLNVEDEVAAEAPATKAKAAKPQSAKPKAKPKSGDDDTSEAAGEPVGRPPLLLMPLWLLSWPAMHLPEHARNALGKAAVVTIINAVAVLAYVLVFRRT